MIKNLRILNNPIMTEALGGPKAREFVIARTQFLVVLNGATLSDSERKDSEILYMNRTYQEFL